MKQIIAGSIIILGWLGSIMLDRTVRDQASITQDSGYPIGEDQVVEPTVTRSSAGLIVIEGADYALVRPHGQVLRGLPLPQTEIGMDEGEGILYSVDRALDYEVQTAVYYLPHESLGENARVAKYFTVQLPITRIDQVQRYLELTIELQLLKNELGTIGFFEYVDALKQYNQEQEDRADANGQNGQAAPARDRRDD